MSNKERIRRSIARTVMKKMWRIIRATGKALNEALKLAWMIVKQIVRSRYTKLRGVTFDSRQELLGRMCNEDYRVIARRDKMNIYDDNAIAVWITFRDGTLSKLGYVSKELAASVSPEIDKGLRMHIISSEVIGKGYKNLGLAFQYVIYW